MLTNEQSASIAPKLLSIQIISAAILMGAVCFAVVIAFIVNWEELTTTVPLMTLIGAATGVSLLMLSFVAPRIAAANTVQATAFQLAQKKRDVDDEQTLLELVQQLTVNQIIFSALIEGAIFLNLIVFMLDKSQVSLFVVGIGLVILILSFPTGTRIQNRLVDRMESIKAEMRHIG